MKKMVLFLSILLSTLAHSAQYRIASSDCGDMIEGRLVEGSHFLYKVCLEKDELGDEYETTISARCMKGFTEGRITDYITINGMLHKSCLRISSLDSNYETSEGFGCHKDYTQHPVKYLDNLGFYTIICNRK